MPSITFFDDDSPNPPIVGIVFSGPGGPFPPGGPGYLPHLCTALGSAHQVCSVIGPTVCLPNVYNY